MSDLRENYLRVTNVLYPFSGLEQLDPSIVARAAERGTKVHKICEGIASGLGELGVDKETSGYVESFKKWWDQGRDVVLMEERFFDDDLKLTGQVDFILNTPEGLAIVDLKTSSKPSKTWRVQGNAYAYLAKKSNLDIQKIFFVHLSKTGKKPKIYEYPVDDSFFLRFYGCSNTSSTRNQHEHIKRQDARKISYLAANKENCISRKSQTFTPICRERERDLGVRSRTQQKEEKIMDNLPAVRSCVPSEHEMMVFTTMAKQAVDSKMYRGIGDQAGVMMIMLAARELGIPPMQALNGGINIIQGKVEISARMMGAMIRRAGHMFSVKEISDSACTIIGKRCDTGETQTASFSVADAQRAGLVKTGGNWTKFPKDMCYARALSRLARQLFSDVIGIGYIEGEIKEAENPPPVPAELAIEEAVIIESESEFTEQYLNLFNQDDKGLALEYLKTVKQHFNWSVIQTVKELIADKSKLFEKFNAWKSKIQKVA